MSDFKLPSWIMPYRSRKYFPRKVRDTEKEIRLLKANGEWVEATKKEYQLRNVWWGYKKYKKNG